MRAVKRVRYGEKELVKLNKLVDLDKTGKEDFPMKDLVTVTDISDRTSNHEQTSSGPDAGMDVDSKYDRKTHKDEHGHYPAWMNQRSVHRLKRKAKHVKKTKAKKVTKKSKK